MCEYFLHPLTGKKLGKMDLRWRRLEYKCQKLRTAVSRCQSRQRSKLKMKFAILLLGASLVAAAPKASFLDIHSFSCQSLRLFSKTGESGNVFIWCFSRRPNPRQLGCSSPGGAPSLTVSGLAAPSPSGAPSALSEGQQSVIVIVTLISNIESFMLIFF